MTRTELKTTAADAKNLICAGTEPNITVSKNEDEKEIIVIIRPDRIDWPAFRYLFDEYYT